MFEIVVLLLFCWLFFKAIGLAFKVAWGAAKVIAVVLSVVALPILIVCLLFAGGFVLLLPVVLIAAALGILRSCV
ncbi:MAG: hypothetical protein IJZ85_13750 [Lachnospiraceae bacterium]|nr:hypothetical protein [Lachnospiraceae bacterium]